MSKEKILSVKYNQLVHYCLWFLKENGGKPTALRFYTALWFLDVKEQCSKKESMSGEEVYLRERSQFKPLHIDLVFNQLNVMGLIELRTHRRGSGVDFARTKISDPYKNKVQILSDDELENIKSSCEKFKFISSEKIRDHFRDDVYDAYVEGEKVPLVVYYYGKAKKPTAEDIAWAESGFDPQKTSALAG